MVHIVFDPSSVSFNDFSQYGGGEITYFKGLPPYQRGAGLGDVLRGLWRTFLPLLKSAGKTVGKEALSTGSRILDKVAQGDNLKDTLVNEGRTGVENIIQRGRGRQSVSGIKRLEKSKRTHFHKRITNPIIIGRKVVPSKKRSRSDAFGLY